MATSGNGGTVTIGATILHVTRWTGQFGARLADSTDSSTASSTFTPVLYENSFSAEGVWDEDNLPDTDVGAYGGAVVNATLKCGASGKLYVISNAAVENLNITVDNTNDVVRFSLSAKGGTRTNPST